MGGVEQNPGPFAVIHRGMYPPAVPGTGALDGEWRIQNLCARVAQLEQEAANRVQQYQPVLAARSVPPRVTVVPEGNESPQRSARGRSRERSSSRATRRSNSRQSQPLKQFVPKGASTLPHPLKTLRLVVEAMDEAVEAKAWGRFYDTARQGRKIALRFPKSLFAQHAPESLWYAALVVQTWKAARKQIQAIRTRLDEAVRTGGAQPRKASSERTKESRAPATTHTEGPSGQTPEPQQSEKAPTNTVGTAGQPQTNSPLQIQNAPPPVVDISAATAEAASEARLAAVQQQLEATRAQAQADAEAFAARLAEVERRIAQTQMPAPAQHSAGLSAAETQTEGSAGDTDTPACALLREQLRVAHERIDTVTSELAAKSAEQDTLRAEMAALKNQNAELQARLSEASAKRPIEQKTTGTQSEAYRDVDTSTQTEIHSLQQQLGTAEAELKTTKTELASLRAQLAALQTRLSKERADRQDDQRATAITAAIHRDTIASQQREIARLHALESAARAQVDDAAADATTASRAHAGQLRQAQDALEATRAELAHVRGVLQQRDREREDETTEMARLGLALQDTRRELGLLQSSRDQMAQANAAQAAAYQQALERIHYLEATSTTWSVERTAQEDRQRQLEAELRTLQDAARSQVEAQAAADQAEYAQKIATLEQRLVDCDRAWEARLAQVVAELQEARAQSAQKVAPPSPRSDPHPPVSSSSRASTPGDMTPTKETVSRRSRESRRDTVSRELLFADQTGQPGSEGTMPVKGARAPRSRVVTTETHETIERATPARGAARRRSRSVMSKQHAHDFVLACMPAKPPVALLPEEEKALVAAVVEGQDIARSNMKAAVRHVIAFIGAFRTTHATDTNQRRSLADRYDTILAKDVGRMPTADGDKLRHIIMTALQRCGIPARSRSQAPRITEVDATGGARQRQRPRTQGPAPRRQSPSSTDTSPDEPSSSEALVSTTPAKTPKNETGGRSRAPP